MTAHYRGAHAGAAAKSGFTCYAVRRRHGGRARWRRPADGASPDRRGAAPMTLPPAPDRWTIELANAQRMEAIAAFGFTERQARFLLQRPAALGRLRRAPVLQLRRHRPWPEEHGLHQERSSSGGSPRRSRPGSSIAAGCSTSTTSRSGRPSASPTAGSGSRTHRGG